MLVKCNLILSSIAGNLFSGPTLHIHLIMLPLCLLVFLVLVLYSITLRTQGEYNLPFAPKGKALLVNKRNKPNKITSCIPYSCWNTQLSTSTVSVSWLEQVRHLISSSCKILSHLLCTQRLLHLIKLYKETFLLS